MPFKGFYVSHAPMIVLARTTKPVKRNSNLFRIKWVGWLSSQRGLLCAAKVKLCRVWLTFGCVTLKVLTVLWKGY